MFRDSTSIPESGVIRVAVAVVLRHSGVTRILVDHRFPDVHLPDLWEFPGGKLEPGESGAQTAIREVFEETAVRVEVRGLLLRDLHSYPDRTVDIEFYVCDYLSGIPSAQHCQGVRWVAPEHLEIYPFPTASRTVIDALTKGGWLGGNGSRSG